MGQYQPQGGDGDTSVEASSGFYDEACKATPLRACRLWRGDGNLGLQKPQSLHHTLPTPCGWTWNSTTKPSGPEEHRCKRHHGTQCAGRELLTRALDTTPRPLSRSAALKHPFHMQGNAQLCFKADPGPTMPAACMLRPACSPVREAHLSG